MSNKTRGAISVFLTIILVPCLLVSSIFVDLGRVHLSKSEVKASSDLALNTLMTNYDADLKEWYGMIASCQNIEEFYDISAKYFLRTIQSQGLTNDEIYLLSDYYANATGNDKIHDLLKATCLKTDNIVSEVKGADLTNATILKDQVVEFMKYRAPIEITTDVIERLKNVDFDAVKNADKDKELTDAKQDYYEAEGELLAKAYYTYLAIMDYYNVAFPEGDPGSHLTLSRLQKEAEKISHVKTDYQNIHKAVVTNLLNTDNLKPFYRVTMELDKYNNQFNETDNSVYTKAEGGTYFINADRVTKLLDELDEAIEKFKTEKNEFGEAAKQYVDVQTGNSGNQANAVQLWVRLDNAVCQPDKTSPNDQLKKAAENMLKAYSRVMAISNCTPDGALPAKWENDRDELVHSVQSLQGKFLVAGISDGTDAYLKAVNRLEKLSSENINNIYPETLYVTYGPNNQKTSVKTAISSIKAELTTFWNDMDKLVKYLEIAIDGGKRNGEKVVSLDKLSNLARDYRDAYNTWKNTAYATDTELGRSDRAEIEGRSVTNSSKEDEDQGLEMAEKITPEAVGQLKTRLKGIKTQLETVKTGIDKLKYGGKKIRDIGSFDTFVSQTKTKASPKQIGLTNQEISSYADSTFNQLFKPTDSATLKLKDVNNSQYNPQIDPETGSVKTPELFMYFYKKFPRDEDTVKEKQSEVDDGKSGKKDAEDAAKDKGRYHGGGSDITATFSAGSGTANVSDELKGFINLISSLISGNFTEIRDDMYTTCYIMNMFSYATFEEEGLYSLIEDKSTLKYPSGNAYRPSQYNDVMGDANTKGTWLSANPEDSYNKTLKNNLINKANNAAYEAEVEYILNGGKNEDNVKAVYSKLYGIRYSLNIISGFMNFWSSSKNNTAASTIQTLANSIQAATQGIIPAPLTKSVLIALLTAYETAADLNRLEAGYPVELFKTSHEQWWVAQGTGGLKVKEFISSLLSPNGEHPKNGLFYSDYLMVFVYLGLSGENSAGMYKRMAEVIQENMRTLTNSKGEDGYSMEKARVYFQVKTSMRVSPLMVTIPYFKSDDYHNTMETAPDWCTYDVETIRGYS